MWPCLVLLRFSLLTTSFVVHSSFRSSVIIKLLLFLTRTQHYLKLLCFFFPFEYLKSVSFGNLKMERRHSVSSPCVSRNISDVQLINNWDPVKAAITVLMSVGAGVVLMLNTQTRAAHSRNAACVEAQ